MGAFAQGAIPLVRRSNLSCLFHFGGLLRGLLCRRCRYACFNSMLTLRSGATIICGSFPAVSCHLSTDGNAKSWRMFTFDVSGANVQGGLLELSDGEVLYVYGGRAPSAGAPPYGLRSARLRVANATAPQRLLAVKPN